MKRRRKNSRDQYYYYYNPYLGTMTRLTNKKCHIWLESVFYSALTLTIGTLIGTTIAFACFYEISYQPRSSLLFDSSERLFNEWRNSDDFDQKWHNNESVISWEQLTFRCVVIVSELSEYPHKQIAAIKDTWAKKCTETVYYTTDRYLKERFEDQIDIYSIFSGRQSTKSWNLWKDVLRHAHANRSTVDWTFISDERTFFIPENFGHFVNKQNVADSGTGQMLIVGKPQRKFSILSFLLFNWNDRPMNSFNLDAGVAISRKAMEKFLLATKKNTRVCSGLFFPGQADTALASCFSMIGGIKFLPNRETEPPAVRSEEYFLALSPKVLIPDQGNRPNDFPAMFPFRHLFTSGGQEPKNKEKNCCNDRAVTFGQLTYREIRMLSYTVYNLRVFGHSNLW